MFKDNTVFVIGAGASQEFGLPIGSGLMNMIKENCDFQFDDFKRLKNGALDIFVHYDGIYGRRDEAKLKEFNRRLNASRQISRGIDPADSIDEYIYRYSDDSVIAEVGKLQIAYAISGAESSSMLSLKKGFRENKDAADGTWIWSFFKALINGVRASEVDRIGKNITIITFNYDRCIEHYLEYALTRAFHGMKLEEARDIVGNIKIIHPYGSLGDLEEFPFGEADSFVPMADNLITWSETIKDPDIVRDMRKAIRGANRIVFMGFAFANQNMVLLDSKPTETNYSPPKVYATGYGLPRESETSLCENISALYSNGILDPKFPNIHFQYGAKCKEFFDIHRLNIVQ